MWERKTERCTKRQSEGVVVSCMMFIMGNFFFHPCVILGERDDRTTGM